MNKNNFNLPKNIKQIGNIDENFKIYVEDFVFSFLNQYAKNCNGEEGLAVLIGEHFVNENKNVLFISGAIKAEDTIMENGIVKMSEKSLEKINANIDTYFLGKQIVGWFYSQPGFADYINEEYLNYHKALFKEYYKVFFLFDPVENINSFYKYRNQKFEDIKGFIIYYEKNDAMQEYMLNNKENNIDIAKENFKEKDKKLTKLKNNKTQNIKVVEKEKNKPSMLLYLTGVLFIICFVMAISLIQNDDKIQALESSFLKLDQNYKYILNQLKNENVQSVFAENTSYYEQETETTQTTETKEITEAQTTTETTQTTQAETGDYIEYEIKAGDTLEYISQKFYNTSNKVDEIIAFNEIENPDKIYEGMLIKIPTD